MKQYVILAFVIFCLLKCTTPQTVFSNTEDELILTKTFVGRYVTSVVAEKSYTKVYTTKEVINVKLEGDTIPNNALCYLQLKAYQLAGQLSSRT